MRRYQHPISELSTCSWQAKSKGHFTTSNNSMPHPASVNFTGGIIVPQLSFDLVAPIVSPKNILKRCKACNEVFDIAKFNKDGSKSDGYSHYCRICERAFVKEASKKTAITYKAQTRFNMLVEEGKKRCYKCKLVLDRAEFSIANRHKDGLNPTCKVCTNKAQRYYDNRSGKAVRKARYDRNPDKQIVHVLHNRCQKLGIESTLTYQQWQEFKHLSGNKCAYCGVSGDNFKLVIDHVFPLSLAKRDDYYTQFAVNTLDNIAVSCELCNLAKLDRPLIIFLGWLHRTLG